MSGTTIRVTVIIAAYNAEDYLHIAFDSVLRQTEANLELIIVDDCSQDGTWQVAKSYEAADERVHAVKMPQNSGQYISINHALSLAGGEWIAILDSDDWFDPARLKTVIDEAEAAGVNIAADNCSFYDAAAKVFYRLAFPSASKKPQLIDRKTFISRSNPLVHNRSDFGLLKPVFRSSTLKQHGITYLKARNGGDYYFLLSWLIQGEKILLLPHFLYFYVDPVGVVSRKLSRTSRKPYPFLVFKATNDLFLQQYQAKLMPQERSMLQKRGNTFVSLERSDRFRNALRNRKYREAYAIYLESPVALPLVVFHRGINLLRLAYIRKYKIIYNR